jgi:signal transduction histidine kinase
MNKSLQNILNLVEQNQALSNEQKKLLEDWIKETDKTITISEFKLERTEKVKRTTAILLEETITELENKRKAIEEQNRELEIESSLERVRTVAMAMKQPNDMLDICKIISLELAKLKVKEIRNVQTAIFYEDQGIYMNYEYYSKHDRLLVTEVEFKNHPNNYEFAQKMMQGPDEFYTLSLEGEKLKEWYEYQKTTPQFADSFLETASSLNYYFSSMGPVAFGISTYFPLDEEETELFKRFRNVFELAYRRYLDIEKAEAQAREAQIELGLERVRARAMAMQKSDELSELVDSVFKELTKLDFALTWCIINIIDEPSLTNTVWAANPDIDKAPECYHMKFEDYPFHHAMMKGWKERKTKYVYILEGVEKKIYDEYLFNETEFRKVPEAAQAASRAMEKYVVTFSFSNFGGLQTVGNVPLSEANLDILSRFGKVFDLTYTRFNDLKQAEAQARESQIQLALERVRARTMAMQRSDELGEAASLLFKQVSDLGIETWTSGFNIWEKDDTSFIGYNPTPTGGITAPYRIPSTEDRFFIKIYETKKRGEDFLVFDWKDESLAETYRYMKTLPVVKDVLKTIEDAGFKLPTFQINHCTFFSNGFLLFITLKPYPEAYDIFKRFGKVFEQTYTRFLDLQKAEAQTREGQIQLALERIRARTMAMQRSDELPETSFLLFQQLQELGETAAQLSIGIFQEEKGIVELSATVHGSPLMQTHNVPLDESIVMKQAVEAWKANKKSLQIKIEGKQLKKYNAWRNSLLGTKIVFPEEQWIINISFFSKGFISFSFDEYRSPETYQLLDRFSSVFDLTYTRFLDLKNAEAQTREAQIEASLEKVRSSAMAMHNSNDISATMNVVFAELRRLDIQSKRCGVALLSKNSRKGEIYAAATSADGEFHTLTRSIEMTQHPSQVKQYESWLAQENYVAVLSGDELKSYYELPFFYSSASYVPPEHYDQNEYGYYIPFSEGLFYAWTEKPYSDNEVIILNRFKSIIDLTFRRFFDLQKAEAQAREAQIEAALERVRSKAMAMHKTEDLNGAVAVVFEELEKLDLGVLRCGISILDKEKRTGDVWVTSTTDQGSAVQVSGDESFDIHPLLHGAFEAWLKQEDYYYVLEGDDLTNYYKAVKAARFELPESQFISSGAEHKKQYCNVSAYHAGGLFAFRESEFPDEAKKVMKRFANVFDLTYKRFLDIQKAEAQAREAKIEAALERVRAKAMAMHESDDLSTAVATVFEELDRLQLGMLRCGIGIVNGEKRTVEVWSTSVTDHGSTVQVSGDESMDIHPLLQGAYDAWARQGDFSYVLQDEDLVAYYKAVEKTNIRLPELQQITAGGPKQFYYTTCFHAGGLYAYSETEFSKEAKTVMKRFVNVFDLTYKRFLDLQKAEAQALEAIKRASVDRVRAEIASMRTTSDLERITPLVWNELTTLGVPFIRCGVFIMDEEKQEVQTLLSAPDGKAIAAFRQPYNAPGEISAIVNSWHKKEIYKQHWNEIQFIEFAKNLVQQGAVASGEKYLTENRPTDLYLHFLPFLQGMLYVGNDAPLSENELQLVQNLGDAFSTAYARYEDFNKLEAAKKQVDNTLNELQITQRQLIQSEKMASLGELTAGIAHEIQNPLNFVNNFSEVSSELLDEMKTELDRGDADEAKVIADDVKQNLEKILHHGKRADAIVKGMLQHSRTSSGQKELTDINMLADEYLRLSYHGLRAKDKTFNAKFETKFDNSIGKISILPQDTGRVILNLINNAFYAVTEKKKNHPNGYEPTVMVSTKKLGDKIELRVIDNGNGIPQKVLDKIFQPFFTTKPTGEGTGLGLSLSYDIITKGHGGELKVETKEGEGSEFIVRLPT